MGVYIRPERAKRQRRCPQCKKDYKKGTVFVTGYGYKDYGSMCWECVKELVIKLFKEEKE